MAQTQSAGKTLNIHSLHVKHCKLSVLNLENPVSMREIRIISADLKSHLLRVKFKLFPILLFPQICSIFSKSNAWPSNRYLEGSILQKKEKLSLY